MISTKQEHDKNAKSRRPNKIQKEKEEDLTLYFQQEPIVKEKNNDKPKQLWHVKQFTNRACQPKKQRILCQIDCYLLGLQFG